MKGGVRDCTADDDLCVMKGARCERLQADDDLCVAVIGNLESCVADRRGMAA